MTESNSEVRFSREERVKWWIQMIEETEESKLAYMIVNAIDDSVSGRKALKVRVKELEGALDGLIKDVLTEYRDWTSPAMTEAIIVVGDKK